MWGMEFGWHEAKHERNIRQRGFGFDVASAIFLGHVITTEDDRRDYGEVRMRAIGGVGGRVFVVVYTDRGEQRWIISARLANKKERAQWIG